MNVTIMLMSEALHFVKMSGIIVNFSLLLVRIIRNTEYCKRRKKFICQNSFDLGSQEPL